MTVGELPEPSGHQSCIMRFVVSAILGLVVTLAMLIGGLQFFDGRVGKSTLRQGIEVTPLPAQHRLDVAEWMREARPDLPDPGAEPMLRLPPPEPFELAPREVSGFVQLTFTVQPDGRATDVRIFGAAPAGHYEEQAIESVLARRWDPDLDASGRPVARRATEIVEFTVPIARRD
jgi:hypothetical protein